MIIGKKRRYIKTLEQKLAASEAERSRTVRDNRELREIKAAIKDKTEKQEKLLLDKQTEVDEALKSNGELKRQLDEANKLLKEAAYTNAELQQQLLTRPSCDGCINADNYRKCASCARYPKLKDKYEAEAET